MSDGYITSKHLSGTEGLTGVARTQAQEREKLIQRKVEELAAKMIKEERQKKESNIKKEKRKKKTVAATKK